MIDFIMTFSNICTIALCSYYPLAFSCVLSPKYTPFLLWYHTCMLISKYRFYLIRYWPGSSLLASSHSARRFYAHYQKRTVINSLPQLWTQQATITTRLARRAHWHTSGPNTSPLDLKPTLQNGTHVWCKISCPAKPWATRKNPVLLFC